MNWYVTALTEESLTPESDIDQSQLSLCLPRPLIGQELPQVESNQVAMVVVIAR